MDSEFSSKRPVGTFNLVNVRNSCGSAIGVQMIRQNAGELLGCMEEIAFRAM